METVKEINNTIAITLKCLSVELSEQFVSNGYSFSYHSALSSKSNKFSNKAINNNRVSSSEVP